MSGQRTYASPPDHWNLAGSYSAIYEDAVRCRNMIFIRGQADLDKEGVAQNPGNLMAQTRNVMRSIEKILREFHADFSSLVRLIVYYVNDIEAEESQYADFVGQCLGNHGGAGPVVTFVPLPCLALPHMAVEIDADAMIGEEGTPLPRAAAQRKGHAPLSVPFSHALRCKDMVFLGGEDARSESGVIMCPGDILAQTNFILDRVQRTLAEFGASLADVVKIRRYVVTNGEPGGWEAGAVLCGDRFTDPAPVITDLGVRGFQPDAIAIRMDFTAMIGEDGGRMPRQAIRPKNHWTWPIPLRYSHGLRCGDLVYVGGQLPASPKGKVLQPLSVEDHARASMDNVQQVLRAAGLEMEHVVRINAFYLSSGSPDDLYANVAVRNSYFRHPGPATSGVPVPTFCLGEVRFQAEVLAMMP